MTRNFVKQMASDGFLPVIALEACVEAGRTYQAYKRGGFDEARERITEEFMGAVFWLGGVTALNAVFEKIGQKILKLPKINVDISDDDVRTPFKNYLKNEKTVKGLEISEKMMTRFKFVKVLSSVLIANAFIGFILPKVNQAITRSYHKNKPSEQNNQQNISPYFGLQNFSQFGVSDKKPEKKDISFEGLNLLSIANKLESDRNWKLLSVDAGTSSGRVISARNNDERVEIAFRDLASIYFYMFNMPVMNSWLNKLEHGKSSRLDPVSAEFATKYFDNFVEQEGKIEVGSKVKSVEAEKFVKEMLGQDVEIPSEINAKLSGKKVKTIELDEFKRLLQTNEKYSAEFEKLSQIADKMSELQPKRNGISILTEAQVKGVLGGGYINDPEFLKEFYKNRYSKNKFLDLYRFVSQKDMDAFRDELADYVKSIADKAVKTGEKITSESLRKSSNHNLKLNALNWGLGFVTSGIFLSTVIPKLQYKITQWRTGSNEFPGTAQFRENEKKSA